MGLIVTGRMRFLGKFEGVFPQLPPPTPSFTASPTTGIIPLTVQFTNTTTGTGVAYQWDFNGDGIIDSTDVNPSYTYTTTGNFNVSLTAVTTGGSTTTTIVNYITPYEIPPASFIGPGVSTVTMRMIASDETTFLGGSLNSIPLNINVNDNTDLFIGNAINEIPISANNTISVDTFYTTSSAEIPIQMSFY